MKKHSKVCISKGNQLAPAPKTQRLLTSQFKKNNLNHLKKY